VGNGDGSCTEGATYRRVVGTYVHGPVLARNPDLADALLSMATGQIPGALEDAEEDALRSERLRLAQGGGRSGASKRAGELVRLVRLRSS
jgi:lipid II isoglutaminyl synthase (glutamine-hydrolysing)